MMNPLVISPTTKTPEVHFDAQQGFMTIIGRSIPENALDFFQPLKNWIIDYSESPSDLTILEVKLEYFNTSSSKMLLDLMKVLERMHVGGSAVQIKWFHEEEDEDMLEAGEDYQAIIRVPFEMVSVDEMF